MLSLQTVLDRIRQHGYSWSAVEYAIRLWGLPPIAEWHEAEWHVLEVVL